MEEQSFYIRAGNYLKENLSTKVADISNEALINKIKSLNKQAQGYGFLSEFDVMSYVLLYFNTNLISDEKPLFPWVEDVLSIETISPEEKIEKIHEIYAEQEALKMFEEE